MDIMFNISLTQLHNGSPGSWLEFQFLFLVHNLDLHKKKTYLFVQVTKKSLKKNSSSKEPIFSKNIYMHSDLFIYSADL